MNFFFFFPRLLSFEKCAHIALGMNDILPKPFTKEGLLDMLEVSSSIEFR